MAKGALKTFFRQDAGYPEDQPDLTDFLLDSMIQGGPRMGGAPLPTTAGRVSAMGGMRGYPGQQGAPGPQTAPGAFSGPRGPYGRPMSPVQQAPEMAYPPMPGPPPGAQPMPPMPQPGWMDYLSQATGALADGMNARSGVRSNFFGQVGAQQQTLRDRDFQHAMAERGAMEHAARMAHEYDWRKYGAGRGEAREDRLEKQRQEDLTFRDQLLAQQKAQAEWAGNLQAQVLPMRFDAAETAEDVNALEEKSLLETQGNPAMMARVKEAAEVQRKALQWKKLGQPTFDWLWSPNGPSEAPKFTPPNSYHPWMTPPSTGPSAPPPASLFGEQMPLPYRRTR